MHGDDAATEDEDYEGGDDGIDFRFLEPTRTALPRGWMPLPLGVGGPPGRPRPAGSVLQDLVAARQLLDQALKDG